MHPPLDICVDFRAVYDAIAATDACELAGSRLKFHLILVGDRMTYGLVRKFFWAGTRDVLADGLIKGGLDRMLLRNVSNDCKYSAIHDALVHATFSVVGSAAKGPLEEDQ